MISNYFIYVMGVVACIGVTMMFPGMTLMFNIGAGLLVGALFSVLGFILEGVEDARQVLNPKILPVEKYT